MPVVTFLRDFQGRASAERYYTAGTVVDLPEGQVEMLLAEHVVRVAEPEVPAAPLAVDAGAADPLPAAPARPARKRAARKAAK